MTLLLVVWFGCRVSRATNVRNRRSAHKPRPNWKRIERSEWRIVAEPGGAGSFSWACECTNTGFSSAFGFAIGHKTGNSVVFYGRAEYFKLNDEIRRAVDGASNAADQTDYQSSTWTCLNRIWKSLEQNSRETHQPQNVFVFYEPSIWRLCQLELALTARQN